MTGTRSSLPGSADTSTSGAKVGSGPKLKRFTNLRRTLGLTMDDRQDVRSGFPDRYRWLYRCYGEDRQAD
jgi:hypothetical protein